MLWRKDELQTLFGLDAEASGVSIDTRSIQPGDLFFGLVGENGVDGMEFAGVAREKGAAAVVAGLENLQKLGEAAQQRHSGKRIAVTGSVGKTTTKELLAAAFGALGSTHAAVASFNNHIGVPLTLSRMPRDASYGVFEIGMNHRGEIAPLARMVKPHAAIITTVAPVHIEYLETLDAIAEEKADIFDGLADDGVALIPADSDHADYLRLRTGAKRQLGFGLHPSADIRVTDVVGRADGALFNVHMDGHIIEVFLPQMGVHIAPNAAAALGAVYVLGGDARKAAAALAHHAPMKGRGERFTHKGITVLDESYNASPVSVAATLKTLATIPCEGRRIAILGDMFELGAQGPALHQILAESVRNLGIDGVVTCGALMKNLYDALPPERRLAHFDTSGEAAVQVEKLAKAKDCVLIKGSNGMKMSKVVEAIRQL